MRGGLNLGNGYLENGYLENGYLENGYLENGYLKGLLTSKIRATAISKNSDCFLKNNLENVNLKNYVRNWSSHYKLGLIWFVVTQIGWEL
jgi:hypothetical protein